MIREDLSAEVIEEGLELSLDFSKLERTADRGMRVIPVVVQDAETKDVILLAYTNEESFRECLRTRVATFWSTSRNEKWVKGASSGQYFELAEVFVNCEQNSLLYLVRPRGQDPHGSVGQGICHTVNSRGRKRNCFYRRLDPESGALENTDP
jgi:phosphoribosyl-AMP cyclohydrolase